MQDLWILGEEERKPLFASLSVTVSFNFSVHRWRKRDESCYSSLASASLSFMASCVGDREERSEGGSECEGELKMTDNSGELKELQRGCGSGR